MNVSPLTLTTDRLIDYFCTVGGGDTLTLHDGPGFRMDSAREVDSRHGGAAVDGGADMTGVLEDEREEGGLEVNGGGSQPVAAAVAGGGGGGDGGGGGVVTPLAASYVPEVVDRWPLNDYKDTPFPTGVANLCFPAGLRLEQMELPQEPLPTFFVFVATGGKQEHVYGHVLVFWERLTEQQAAAVDTSFLPPHHALFIPRCLCILSRWNFPEFRTFLTELYRISLSPSAVPLERIVCNFVTEVPLPPAGKLEVQYMVGDTALVFRRPPRNRRVSAMGLPFREVFECLDFANLLTVFRCVLFEKQVLLVSSQLSLLTATAEVLVSLMYPFRWTHTYIPVLPHGLIEVLQAPLPFLTGLHAMEYARIADSMPMEVVVVLLDSNTIIADPSVVVPHIPPHQRSKLVSALTRSGNVFAHRGPHWEVTRLPNFDSAFTFAARPEDADEAEGSDGVDDDEYANSDDDERIARVGRRESGGTSLGGYKVAGSRKAGAHADWHAVRRAFFRLFVAMLLRYREFLVMPSKDNPTPRSRFNKEAFLATCKPDARPFLEALMATQAFANFIDDCLQPESTDLDIEFFDQSIDEKKNRSVLSLFTKRPTPFLTSKEFAIVKTIIALGPDTSGLVGYPDYMYHYSPFPSSLDLKLFYPAREVPSFADASQPGRYDYLRLRRTGMFDFMAAGRRGSTIGAIFASKSAEENIYTAWFIAFSAAMDIVGDEIARRAGDAFDAAEAAAMGEAARKSTVRALEAAGAMVRTGDGSARPRVVVGEDSGGRALSPMLDAAAPMSPPGPTMDEMAHATAYTGVSKVRVGSVAAGLAIAAPTLRAATSIRELPNKARGGSVAAAILAGQGEGDANAHTVSTMALTASGAKSMGSGVLLAPSATFSLPTDLSVASPPRPAVSASGTGAGVRANMRRAGKGSVGSMGSGAGTATASVLKRREAAIATAKGLYLSIQLETAFAVLDRMKAEGVQPDELVYRSLLEACGRIGNFGKAYQVLAEMQRAGITQDASLYRYLFQAFFHANPDAMAGAGGLSQFPLSALNFKGRAAVGRGGITSAMSGGRAGLRTPNPKPRPQASSPATAPPGGIAPARAGLFGFGFLSPAGSGAAAPVAAPAPGVSGPGGGQPPPPPAPAAGGSGEGASGWFRNDAGSPAASKVAHMAPPASTSTGPSLLGGIGLFGHRRSTPSMSSLPVVSSTAATTVSSMSGHSGLPVPVPNSTASTSRDTTAVVADSATVAMGTGSSAPPPLPPRRHHVSKVAQQLSARTMEGGVAPGGAVPATSTGSAPPPQPTAHGATEAADATPRPLPSLAEVTGVVVSPSSTSPSPRDVGVHGGGATAPSPSVASNAPILPDMVLPSTAGTTPAMDAPMVPPAPAPGAGADGAVMMPATPIAELLPTTMPTLTLHAAMVDRRRPSIVYARAPAATDVDAITRRLSGATDLASGGHTGGGGGGGAGVGGLGAGSSDVVQTMPSSRGGSTRPPTTLVIAEADVFLPLPPSALSMAPPSTVPRSVGSEDAPSSPDLIPLPAPATLAAGLALARRFPQLTIDVARERCTLCGATMTDEDVRKGWNRSENDYTTQHVSCKKAAPIAAAPPITTPAASRRFRGLIEDDRGAHRFVARFTVSSMARTWKGTADTGPGALLYCEYLPPAVLARQLQSNIMNNAFNTLLRVRAGTLFWNLVLWFVSFALPFEFLTFLAREEGDESEAMAWEEGIARMEASAAALPLQLPHPALPLLATGMGADGVEGGPPPPPPPPTPRATATNLLSAVTSLFQTGATVEHGGASVLPPPALSPSAAGSAVDSSTVPATSHATNAPHVSLSLPSMALFTSPVANAWRAMAGGVDSGAAAPLVSGEEADSRTTPSTAPAGGMATGVNKVEQAGGGGEHSATPHAPAHAHTLSNLNMLADMFTMWGGAGTTASTTPTSAATTASAVSSGTTGLGDTGDGAASVAASPSTLAPAVEATTARGGVGHGPAAEADGTAQVPSPTANSSRRGSGSMAESWAAAMAATAHFFAPSTSTLPASAGGTAVDGSASQGATSTQDAAPPPSTEVNREAREEVTRDSHAPAVPSTSETEAPAPSTSMDASPPVSLVAPPLAAPPAPPMPVPMVASMPSSPSHSMVQSVYGRLHGNEPDSDDD